MQPSVEYVAHHIAITCAGQTGTGKTHTTFGIQKMLAHAIFDTSHNLSCCAVNLEVSNSFRTTNLGMALEFVAWTIAIQILLPHILEKFTNPVWDQFFWRAANLFFTFAPVPSLKRLSTPTPTHTVTSHSHSHSHSHSYSYSHSDSHSHSFPATSGL